MRTKLATYALAGALGLTGVAGAALVAPAVSYAATGDSTALADRVTSIKDALAGLVTDGTLTQAQADSVASTLAETPGLGHGPGGRGGPGGPGGGIGGRKLAAVAEDLGITQEELAAAAEAGTTLGALADEQGVSRDALVDALVAAGTAHLAEEVTEGDLTQAEADARAATLEERATASLDEPVCAPGGGRGHHGPRPDDSDDTTTTPAPATPEAGTSDDA